MTALKRGPTDPMLQSLKQIRAWYMILLKIL